MDCLLGGDGGGGVGGQLDPRESLVKFEDPNILVLQCARKGIVNLNATQGIVRARGHERWKGASRKRRSVC